MRLDAYIRVSRVGKRGGASFISPAVQRERCEGIAKAGGHEIIAFHEDLDESGGRADRPGFQKALARIEGGQTEGIVVAKLDRFARSVADAAAAMKRIEGAGGALMVAESSLDTSTSFGRFAMHMMLALAELELERIRENWDDARASAVARGVHVASRTPTGYARDEARRLAPNRDAAVITEAFHRKARGASWGEVAALLEEAEVLTPYGSAFWTTGSLRGVLSNRVYLGEARSGDHSLPAAHEALVDEATWRAAQRVKGRRSTGTGVALLAGILRCAGCRYAMKPSKMTGRNGERIPMYSCRGKKAAGKCPAPTTVLARLIEPWVEGVFLAEAGGASAAPVASVADTAEAQAAVELAEGGLDAFLEADIQDTVGVERYRRELKRRQAELDAARDELARLAARGNTGLPDAAELRRLWPDLSIEERRQLLSLGINAIFLRRPPRRGLSDLDNRVFVAWRGQGPDDLPGTGPAPVIRSFDW